MTTRYVIAYDEQEVESIVYWSGLEETGYELIADAEERLATYEDWVRDDFRIYRVEITPVGVVDEQRLARAKELMDTMLRRDTEEAQ
jgi:hypothetical protein